MQRGKHGTQELTEVGSTVAAQVQRLEIPQIVEAICELNSCDVRDCDIPITYVVVSKGHHTRLFPAMSRDGDRNGNVFPGEPSTPLMETFLKSTWVSTYAITRRHGSEGKKLQLCCCIIIQFLAKGKAVCRQGAVKGARYPTLSWTCQIQARPNSTVGTVLSICTAPGQPWLPHMACAEMQVLHHAKKDECVE